MRSPPQRTGGRRVDLHAHTTFSDGLLTPEALIARAAEKRLAAVAVTDHDTIEALPHARAAAAGGLEVVAGVEISSALDGQDLHILGYYIDPEHEPLRERLVRFQMERRERALQIVRRLAELGMSLDPEAVLEAAGPGAVGRPHVAAALVRAGHVGDLEEAFRRFLGARGAAFVARPAFHPEEAVRLIHAAHGVSVLAHPGLLSDAVVERLAAAGLRGVEVWHPHHTPTITRRWRALTERLGLLETGGSDFHGQPRAADLGDLDVPYGALLRLKQSAGIAGS